MTGATSGFSQTVVGYFTNATLEVDKFDSAFLNDGPIAFTSTIGGQEFVIQGRPVPFDGKDIVPMNYKVATAGNYAISIDRKDGLFAGSQSIYLRDLLTGIVHDLKGSPYTFVSEAGRFNNRFEIMYQTPLRVSSPTFTSHNVIVSGNDVNEVVINSGAVLMRNVSIYDIRGRLLKEHKGIHATETRIVLPGTNQVFLVQITSEDGVMVTKKIVR